MDQLIVDQLGRMGVVFGSKDTTLPNIDERRTLYVAFRSEETVEDFVLRETVVLVWSRAKQAFGNHYHPIKCEAFCVLRGYMQVTLRNVGGTITFPMESGDRLIIPPLTAHRFETMTEQGILLVHSDRRWSEYGDVKVTDL